MRKVILDGDTNTILLANVKELENGVFEIISGEPKDITRDALKAVFNWFANQKTKGFESVVSIKESKYELALRKKE